MQCNCDPERNDEIGYSLIELMTVLAVVSILLMIGVPSFAGLIQNNSLVTTTNEFLSSINLTRAEAIQRGQRVDMLPVDASGDWSKGWVVVIDENGNQKPDNSERVIFSHDAVPAGMRVKAQLTDSTVQYLAYNGAGRTRTNANNDRTQFGTFTFELNGKIRKIKLNFLGRPRICNPELEKSTC